jgi:hypothetical protein
MSGEFDRLYAANGWPSIAREKLLRALQLLYTIRSEQLLMEHLDYNPLFRWFVGLNMDDAVWVPTVFSKNRDRLLAGDIASALFEGVVARRREKHSERADTTGLIAIAGAARGSGFGLGQAAADYAPCGLHCRHCRKSRSRWALHRRLRL